MERVLRTEVAGLAAVIMILEKLVIDIKKGSSVCISLKETFGPE